MLDFRFLSVPSVLAPHYSASVSSFPLLPASASQWLPRCALSAFASLAFSGPSDPVSRAFSLGSSYSASCLFPFIPPGFAPTAIPPVLPFRFRLRAFPSLLLSFVRFRSVLTTQPSVFPFPSSRSPLSAVPTVLLSSSVRPVSMPSFRFRYSALCSSFLHPSSRPTVATPTSRPRPFGFGRSPWLSL